MIFIFIKGRGFCVLEFFSRADIGKHEKIMEVMNAVLICRALSASNCLNIVKLLTDDELCACELFEDFNITQPTLLHHMKILSGCGLISVRKDSTKTFYALNCYMLTAFRDFI